MPNAFVDRAPKVDLGRGANVSLTLTSGRTAFEFMISRGDWRRFLETELRNLNESEAAEQGRVVTFRGRRPRVPPKEDPGGGQRTCPD